MSFFSDLMIEVTEMYQRGLTVNEISNLLLVPESMIASVIESLENGEYGDDFACEFDIVTEEE